MDIIEPRDDSFGYHDSGLVIMTESVSFEDHQSNLPLDHTDEREAIFAITYNKELLLLF